MSYGGYIAFLDDDDYFLGFTGAVSGAKQPIFANCLSAEAECALCYHVLRINQSLNVDTTHRQTFGFFLDWHKFTEAMHSTFSFFLSFLSCGLMTCLEGKIK